MKQILIIITIIISLISIPIMSYAEITVDSKAEALNRLTILQGDGVNFNLKGQLKRSEAITFIVRIMGQEAFIKTNSVKYSMTTFNDVKTTDWFAPYVGYCKEQNILNGFPDGGFHPNETISEKAFLKLVLGALEYKYEQDFVWDTVYESSFNLGLVADVKYQTQIADNNKYLRSDVISVLYGSLKVKIKDKKNTIIENLIERNIVSSTIAIELGLAKETEPIILTTIVKAEATNGVVLNIYLNKTVNLIQDKDILIYETENKNNILNASVTSQVYGNIVITTAMQIPNKNYIIELTTLDENKLPSKATSTFKGYIVPEVKSNYFKINKIVTVSKNILYVYFTQPITNNDIVSPVYYDILKNNVSFLKGNKNNMSVKLLPSENNAVAIYLKDSFISEDAPYTLKLSGDIISAYGIQLNDGSGDTAIFTGQKLENNELKIVKVYAVDSKTVNLEYNEEIDPASIRQLNNYLITNNEGSIISISNAKLITDGKGKTVQLTTSATLDKTLSYQISVDSIGNLFNTSTIYDGSYPLSGKPIAELRDLKISYVKVIDKLTLQVKFDKKLDSTAAVVAPYYIINGVTDTSFITTPVKVYVNPLDASNVTLYLPTGRDLINTGSYKLKVLSVMPDELGNTSNLDTVSIGFNGVNNGIVKPFITEAIVIGKDTVKVKSSRELLLSGNNLSLSNFSLELKESKNTTISKTPSSIIAIDETTLIIHFDDLDATKGYTLKFNTLTDYAGLSIRGTADGSTSILLKNGDTP